MKKVTSKKLSLGKVKIAHLTDESQSHLKGGAPETVITCGHSQRPNNCIPYSEWRTCWCV
ncbi:class I lanthipeptide [Chitinophaga pendula]|uniref:class I lanthipeptide n=1 Tax=Chitinophaga TaxID=79328 RepID=UPI0012FDC383|nr:MULTISPECIES: class I lanthipeptide [Chitinophaga]UCJ06772.1 class I lanthipeptide [Chitinophaga pendula]